MSTIAYRLVREDLMVFLAGNGTSSEADWDEYLELLSTAAQRLRQVNKPMRVIVFAGESSPNARQRAAIVEALGGLPSKTAAVTTSVLARNVVTVFSWLGLNVRGFAPNDLAGVAEYLDLPPAYLEQACDAARELAPTIGGVSSFTATEHARSQR